MPDRLNFCSHARCQRLATNGSHCDEHKPRRVRYGADRWYDRASWRGPYGARGYHLRHSPICEQCGVEPAVDVHHIDDSWKQTRNWKLFIDQNNMRSLCHACHSKITMQNNREEGAIQ